MIGRILFGTFYVGMGTFLAWVGVNSYTSVKWYHVARLPATWFIEVLAFVYLKRCKIWLEC